MTATHGDPLLSAATWSKIAIDQKTGCWVWLGGKTKFGYGKFCGTMAHLVIYRRLVGSTPIGLKADHGCHDPATCIGGVKCPHRSCVNPDHLSWVTQRKNLAPDRRNRWGYQRKPGEALDTCKYNHEFTPENTRWNLSRGVMVRRCKACSRETSRQWQLRNRGKDPGAFAPRLDSEPRKKPLIRARTHCPHGHAMIGTNVYRRPDGKGTECRRCRNSR